MKKQQHLIVLCPQEPGSHEEILDFVAKYGVTFDLFSKIDVNGAAAEQLYQVRQGPFPKDWALKIKLF